MLTRVLSACAFAVLAAAMSGAAYAQRSSENPHSPEGSESFSPALVGTWKSAPDETPLSTDFDQSVWGKHARSVRIVELHVDASGHGTLTVTKKVVDARGRTVATSASVEQAALLVGGSHRAASTRIEHEVKVVSAVRTYPDDPSSKWDLMGLRVEIATFADGDGNTLEVRVEPPGGTGSFWETLRRSGGKPSQPTTDQQSKGTKSQPERVSPSRLE